MKRSLLAIPLAALVAMGAATIGAAPAAADPIEFISVGSAPFGVAFTPDNSKAYVANRGDDSVSVIDVASSTVITTITGIPLAMGVAVTPDGSTVYVTSDTTPGAVALIETATDTLLPTTIALTVNNAESITISPNGLLAYVTSWNSGTVSVISTVSNTVTTSLSVTAPTGVAFSADNTEAWVTSAAGDVTRIDTAGPTILVGVIPVSDALYRPVRQGDSLFFLGLGTGKLYTASLVGEPATFDPAPISVTVGGASLQGLAVRSDFRGIVGSDAGAISVYDGTSNTIVDTFTEGAGGDFDYVAISPDGSVAYLTEYSAAGQVAVVRWPAIAAASAPAGQPGAPYSFSVPGTGSRTLSYAITGGTLPAGLALNSVTGAITGTPTAVGNSSFTVTVSSTLGSASHNYAVRIGSLAATGPDTTLIITTSLVGAGALAAGALLILVRRRWRATSHHRS